MKIRFIGTGSAFTLGDENYQSNMLITDANENHLLIDCGTDARHALDKLNYSYQDITDVYITHLHADHAGGLEWLGFTRKFDPNCNKANLFLHESMIDLLWENSLSAGMRSIEHVECNLETYFNPKPISAAQPEFSWQDVAFKLIKTQHVFDNEEPMPCFALFFELDGKKVFFTADTVFSPDVFNEYYQAADFIFHDCETIPYKSGVHAHFEELKELPSDIKSKMWLYHYNPGPLPDAVSAGFIGFVQPRQEFDFNDLTTLQNNKE